MPDLLCRVLDVGPTAELIAKLGERGVVIRRPNPWEKTPVLEFIRREFTQGWADETEVAFARQPICCFVAWREKEVLGFSAYECTRRGFFGPLGVAKGARGLGLGRVLTLASLQGLAEMGYVYGIIGDTSELEFYRRVCGATPIDGEPAR